MSAELNFILKARNISKVYKTSADEIKVFENLDVDIAAKTAVAIIGQSGRGKTTLLNLLSGLDRPNSGEIFFRDNRFDHLNEERLSEFRNKNIGFIFQHHYLLEDFTALENILIPLRIGGEPIRKENHKKALDLLDQLGLKDRAEHYPDQLSGGERQRVAIARALIHNPDLVFADEPTGSLDKKNSSQIESILWDLKKNFEKTFVIATHNLEIAKKCDKIIDLG
jgi:lipoprotein-releasing system ATP-binding protein